MAQQLHPPIWRLCEPIEGIESAQIAECLGLDPAKFHRAEMASSAAEGASAYQNSAASARDLASVPRRSTLRQATSLARCACSTERFCALPSPSCGRIRN